jgi:hypothetical protein
MTPSTEPSLRDNMNDKLWSEGILIKGDVTDAYSQILTMDAIRFIANGSAARKPSTPASCLASCPIRRKSGQAAGK